MIAMPLVITEMSDIPDRLFMEKLYLEYHILMFHVAHEIVGDYQITEDMVSEACIAMIRYLDTIRELPDPKQKRYIISIVRNCCYTYLREKRKEEESIFRTEVSDPSDNDAEAAIDSTLIYEAETQMLELALQSIDKGDRELLEMKYMENLTDAEIAEVRNIKAGSVRSCLTKARRRLKSALLALNERHSDTTVDR